MQFKEINTSEAEGWTLAHSLLIDDQRIPKNTLISADLAQRIAAAGIESFHAYRLDGDDIDENEAAQRIAHHIAAEGVKVSKPSRGRCNLYADVPGLVSVDATLDTLNSIDPAIGIATLPQHTPVSAGKLIATVKIIPYGVKREQVESLVQEVCSIQVASYRPFSVALISSGAAISSKALLTTKNRLDSVGGTVTESLTCAHTVAEVSNALKAAQDMDTDLILLSGISAISDHRDTLPKALETAGGEVIHLGMPVDPGNLLMLGKIGEKTVIGMPGCAKSPSLNGFDWVLERFAARLPLTPEVIQKMGIGGLLKEPVDRPQPRAPKSKITAAETPVILLAAGKSARSGKAHKLLAQLDNKPVIEQTVNTLTNAGFTQIHVVTGAKKSEVESALASHSISFHHNPAYEAGMATSLRTGIRALPETTEQCFVCLADMPFVSTQTFEALLEAAGRISEADIFCPTLKGKRGNPVVWRQNQFGKLLQIEGDKGGRVVMREHEDLVCEVPVDDPGILIDLDTPEALAQFGITAND